MVGTSPPAAVAPPQAISFPPQYDARRGLSLGRCACGGATCRGGGCREWRVLTLHLPTHPQVKEKPSVVRPTSRRGCVPGRGWERGFAAAVGDAWECGGDAERGRGVDSRQAGAPGTASAPQPHLTPRACPRCPRPTPSPCSAAPDAAELPSRKLPAPLAWEKILSHLPGCIAFRVLPLLLQSSVRPHRSRA